MHFLVHTVLAFETVLGDLVVRTVPVYNPLSTIHNYSPEPQGAGG